MLIGLCLAVSACSFQSEVEPPPRSDNAIEIPDKASTLIADIDVDLSAMRRALERDVPTRLWSLSEKGAACVPSQRTEVIGITLKSPTIRCDLEGRVTRGAFTLSGRGRDLIVTMPLRARVTGSDIGGIIEQKTANARANVTARVRLSVAKDWAMRPDVSVRYSWTQPPTVKLLGQSITFADQADKRLGKVVAGIERTIEREIAKIDLKSRIAPVWKSGFAVHSLNRENPPVWLSVTPTALGLEGYSASRNTLSIRMRLDAKTQVIVGAKPEAPIATPLPQMADRRDEDARFTLTLPVIAQYSQLEPVIERALTRRAQRPFDVPVIGQRMIKLASVSAYGTDNNRIAVGVEFDAWEPGNEDDPATGTVWVTARPVNEAGSREVQFIEPEYSAQTSRFTTNVLLEIAKSRDFSAIIEEALTQNFERDFEELMGRVEEAVADQRAGDFTVSSSIETVSTGSLTAYGEGLYLPVTADGETKVRYAPR